MAEQKPGSATGRLIVIIKSAYWIALAIIALVATASYILLQQMMTDHQADMRLLSLVSGQKAQSQRVVFLVLKVCRNDQADRLANGLLCRVAEDSLGRLVPGGDGAMRVLADDRVIG